VNPAEVVVDKCNATAAVKLLTAIQESAGLSPAFQSSELFLSQRVSRYWFPHIVCGVVVLLQRRWRTIRAREALENLLSPELRELRRTERKATWELKQARAKAEWPYVLNSPTGRALLKDRYKEKLIEMRPFLWIELVAWILLGWAFNSWRTATHIC
jgi:hypothetical protein